MKPTNEKDYKSEVNRLVGYYTDRVKIGRRVRCRADMIEPVFACEILEFCYHKLPNWQRGRVDNKIAKLKDKILDLKFPKKENHESQENRIRKEAGGHIEER